MTEETPNKRQRISQACESCRKRKSKCDGAHPICSICKSYNRVCVYDNSGRKRGLQVGYVRSIETVLGVIVRDVPGAEHAVRCLLRDPKVGGTFFDTTFVDLVTNAWHSSKLHEDLKVLLKSHEEGEAHTDSNCLPPVVDQSDLRESISSEPNQYTLHGLSLHVPTSPPQQRDTSKASPDHAVEEQSDGAPAQPDTQSTLRVSSHSTSTKQSAEGRVQPPSLPDNVSELVDEYFNSIHPWFPIIERRDVLYILHSSEAYNGFSLHDRGRCVSLLSIVAVMLASRDFMSQEHTTLHQTGSPTSVHVPSISESENFVRSFASAAIKDQEFGIGHIQAMLLITLIDLGYKRLDTAWINLATICRMIFVYTESKHLQASRLPHVIRGCQVLNILVSTILGRPISNPFDENVSMYLDEDELDEWEVWNTTDGISSRTERRKLPLRALSTFNLTWKLLQRLETAYSTYRRLTFTELLQDLHAWETALPAYCKLSESSPTTLCTLVLQLYFSFTITMILKITDYDSSKDSVLQATERTVFSILDRYTQSSQVVSPYIRFIADVCHETLEEMKLGANTKVFPNTVEYLSIRDNHSNNRNISQRHLLGTTGAKSTRIVPRYAKSNEYQQRNSGIDATNKSNIQDMHVQASSMLDFGSLFANVIPGSLRDANDLSITTGLHTFGSPDFEMVPKNTLDIMMENDFDALLQELPRNAEPTRSVDDSDFAQNLGFLTSDMDAEFLALFEPSYDTT